MTDLTPKERKRLQSQAATKSKKDLRKQADALWQQIVKLEHPQCEVCGLPTRVGHHFFTRKSSSALRYEVKNGIGVCMGCHYKIHSGQPEPFYRIREDRGEYWYDDLWRRKAGLTKRSKAYYEGEIERLTERLEELEGNP